MPLYFFDIKDGHRLVDPRVQNLKAMPKSSLYIPDERR
jgi:hypothetical protein